MAKRRTRKEKVAATWRMLEKKVVAQETGQVVTMEVGQSDNGMALPIEFVRTDLTKTVAVTILALIFQFVIMYYLSAGGWKSVTEILAKIISVY